jgi:hypothetical protein
MSKKVLLVYCFLSASILVLTACSPTTVTQTSTTTQISATTVTVTPTTSSITDISSTIPSTTPNSISTTSTLGTTSVIPTSTTSTAIYPSDGVSDGYIIAGNISGSIGGQTLIWGNAVLVKLDAKGRLEWKSDLELGSTIYSVQTTMDGDFLAAGEINGGNLFVTKVDVTGKVLFEREYDNGSYERGRSIQETKDGGFVITGEIDFFDGNGWQIWLKKFNQAGDIEWSKVLGSGVGNSIQHTSDGGFIIAGLNNTVDILMIKTNENGVIEWENTIDLNSLVRCAIRQTYDGGFIITSGKRVMSALAVEVLIIKTDKDGNKIWDKVFSYSGGDFGYSIEVIKDGGYAITTNAGRIIITDTEGRILWEKTAAGATNLKYNEEFLIKPIGHVDDGYLIALEKSAHELPVDPSVMSPLISQQLIVTKFNLNGDIEWENSYDLPIKK